MNSSVKKRSRANDVATSFLVILIGSPLAVFILFLIIVMVKQLLMFFIG